MMNTVASLAAVWLLTLPAVPNAREVTPARAKAAFEQLKQLAGHWDQRSTRDWEGTASLRVIAGGSAVMVTSNVSPHPGAEDTMVTVFHLDGDRLMLTHYCVARNQPRLVATSISADGRTIEFAFRDATNLRSRDAGHMNRAVYTIESTDRYRSRWTFSQNGQERWMEEIVTTRRR
jgi:hypothetical protein